MHFNKEYTFTHKSHRSRQTVEVKKEMKNSSKKVEHYHLHITDEQLYVFKSKTPLIRKTIILYIIPQKNNAVN